MRKTVISICIICIMIFAGCRAGNNSPSATVQNDSLASSSSCGNAKMLTSVQGAVNYADSTSGNYSLRYTDSGNSNILYTDYLTHAVTYLCAAPNCSHQDETCLSWFSSSCSVFCDSEKSRLFILQAATSQTQDTLWCMELDGRNKEKVFTLKSYETMVDAVAVQGNYLYFTVLTLNDETKDQVKQIRKIDLETKSVSAVLTSNINTWISGAFNDSLAILFYENSQYIFRLLSLTNGNMIDLYSYQLSLDDGTREQGPLTMFYGENLYILSPIEKEHAQITVLNAQTQKSKLLTSDLPFSYRSTTQIIGCYDDHLLVKSILQADQTEHAYAVDCVDGTICELTIKIPHYELQEFLPILGEYENSFLVTIGYSNREMMLYGKDGTTYTVRMDTPKCALIDKNDFWTNKEKFIYLKDYT